MTPAQRAELEAERHRLRRVLASDALQADARGGDAEARRTLDEAAEGLAALDREAAA